MTRPALAAAAVALFAAGVPAQPPAKTAPTRPDEAAAKVIADKTAALRAAVAGLRAKAVPDDVAVEVEVFLRAAETAGRLDEWFDANSPKWVLAALDRGLDRATQAAGGKAPWRDETGRWVARAYRSLVDGSVQPYAVLLPPDYGADPKKKWRLDIVLHGRDNTLTETKFLAQHDRTRLAPKGLDYIQLEPYGRGNNAYRWAGEKDVYEAFRTFEAGGRVDPARVVLRGFSMGGAGVWHIGLHDPNTFCVIGPGAGFTTTHGYVGGLPDPLPDYQEKCLRIYDAVRYAENAFNVPVVAYSGEKDAQKKAADGIEAALKGFPEKLRFTHLIAPGLEHQQPPAWQAKCEAEYRKYAGPGRAEPARVRFVTDTPKYGTCDWVLISALQTTYERAEVDVRRDGNTITGTTKNVRSVRLLGTHRRQPLRIMLDGQTVVLAEPSRLERVNGVWRPDDALLDEFPPKKRYPMAGPIDDAFMDAFAVAAPSAPGWHAATDRYTKAADSGFDKLWDRYFRGPLPRLGTQRYNQPNLVLFGDPQSNPKITEVLPGLPITWTREKLVVNGVSYDPATHLPVLIYPRPKNGGYVVLNSGHTFGEADLKGTNALLYPRLGDWAVIRPTPTARDPAAYEVVAAGLFDDDWRFPKK